MTFRVENHSLRTSHRGQFLDITDDVQQAVERSGIENGMALVYSPHTTCAVLINEKESGYLADFAELLDRLVPVDARYRHDDLEVRENLEEDPHDVPNGWAHCRQSLLGVAGQAIPIADGRVLLGRWQRVFLVELDRARDRRVLIQAMGE